MKLNKHIIEAHAKFHCLICEDVALSSRKDLTEHMKSKHNLPSRCTLCNHFFSSASEVTSHMVTKHNRKEKYECDICKSEFSSPAGLRNHTATGNFFFETIDIYFFRPR